MSAQLLVFTACYNERENIGRLIDEIIAAVPHAHILVVDDNSPDGTWDVIERKKTEFPNLFSVRRPRKLGIGSAHKYALFFAMREGYETLVTMDADFSHDPRAIPALLAAHGKNVFVTGSRYCEGGRSDYTGYRHLVSRVGNVLARAALHVQLRELTTYFRVFDVDSLRRLPLRRVSAAGYSFGVQIVYYLRKAGLELREVPIHFTDRTHGASKIPRMQIAWSALDLAKLALLRINPARDLQPDPVTGDKCSGCGDAALAMKHFASKAAGAAGESSATAAYRCTSVGTRSYPAVYTCLRCDLQQVPSSAIPASLESAYHDVVDAEYLENMPARTRTFERAFNQISPYLRRQRGRLLEVGAYCGLFLKEAQRRGWQGDGVEPSSWAAEFARETLHVNVFPGFLAGNRENLADSYDLVVAWDVLEHVRDPVGLLHECRDLLRADGLLCFSTLDVDTWLPRTLGTRWPWLMDMHVFYFDRHTIAEMLARSGFELVAMEPYAHVARLRYALNGASRMLPSLLGAFLSAASRLVPRDLMLPIAFGDIKVYVARRTAGASPRAFASHAS